MKKQYPRLRSRVIELNSNASFMQAMSDAETGNMGVDPNVWKDASEALVRGNNILF